MGNCKKYVLDLTNNKITEELKSYGFKKELSGCMNVKFESERKSLSK